MANFRGFNIPSLQATLGVAWETIKAKMPENSPCMELIRGTGGAQGGYGQQQPGDNTEMRQMNNGEDGYNRQNSVNVAEESFSYQRNGQVLLLLLNNKTQN